MNLKFSSSIKGQPKTKQNINFVYFVIRFEISLNYSTTKYDSLNFLMITVRDCKSPQVFCHYRLFP